MQEINLEQPHTSLNDKEPKISICRIAFRLQHVPDHLAYNEYILTGYRHLESFRSCLESIFQIHNETVNIWSHIFGVVFFLWIAVWDQAFWLPSYPTVTKLDHVMFSIGTICYILCLTSSVLYHTFMCQDKESFEFCLQIDRFGISLAIYGSFVMDIHCMFYCEQSWGWFYLIVSTIFATSIKTLLFANKIKLMWRSLFRTTVEKIKQTSSTLSQPMTSIQECVVIKRRPSTTRCSCSSQSNVKMESPPSPNLRNIGDRVRDFFTFDFYGFENKEDTLHNIFIVLYIFSVTFGIIPILHWIHDNGGIYQPHVMEFCWYIAWAFFVAFLAVFVYMKRFPECIWPGRFDLLGSSHQIWHLLVILLLWLNLKAVRVVYNHQHLSQTCTENRQFQFTDTPLHLLKLTRNTYRQLFDSSSGTSPYD